MAVRTGIAAATIAIKQLCKLLHIFRPSISSLISAAVTAGKITSSQATILNNWLDAAQNACDIIRLVSGY